MSALAIVGYVAAALALLAVVPSIYVLAREARRRYVERRALARCEAARALLREHERQSRAADATAEELCARFDAVTIQRALETALFEQRRDVELFARLGLTARYLRDLRDGASFYERAHAAGVLGRLGVPDACGPLLAALRDVDEDVTVKRAAADALAQIRDPRAVPHLVRELRAFGASASPHLADALIGFGPVALPALREALGDELVDARVWAARIVGLIGDPSVGRCLLARLGDADARVREAAAEALGRLGDARAAAALMDAALGDPAPRVRASAAAALAQLDHAGAAEALVALLADDDDGVRARALDALVAVRPAEIEPIYRALWDRSPAVRRRAAVAIERIGVLEGWMSDLASEDPGRRERARADVALVARAGLVDSLSSFLGHPDAGVRAAVIALWGELDVPRLGEAIVAKAGDPDAGVRASVAVALGRVRPKGATEVLAKLLGDASAEVAAAAAAALACCATSEVALHLPALLGAMAHASGEVRAGAAAAVGCAGEASAIPALARLLGDAEARVRASAIQAIARIGGEAGRDVLGAALRDPNAVVRVGVASAIGGVGDAAASGVAEVLEERLGDPDLHVRSAAAIALGKIGGPVAERALLRPLPIAPAAVVVARVFLASEASLVRATDDLDADPALRRAVVRLLEEEGEAAWAAFLDRLRCWGRPGLGSADDAEAIAAQVTILRTSPDDEARLAAIAAIDRAGADSGADALADALLGDPSAGVRMAAADALAARLSWPAAKAALSRAALDPSAVVAGAAARALGGLRDPAYAEPLFERLVSGPLAVRSAVEEALARIHAAAPAALLARIAATAAEESEVLMAYARVLERMAEPTTFEALRAMQGALDARVREAAVRAIANVPHPGAAAALGAALHDAQESVRLSAVRAFAPSAREASAFELRSVVRRALQDPSAAVRAAAADVLGVTRLEATRGRTREPASGRRVVGRARRSRVGA